MDDILTLFLGNDPIDLVEFALDIILAGFVSVLIYFVFVKFAHTFSNRRQLGRIFFLIVVCTAVIIAVIKSSIALSLGLVGALSIIRFRAAIKEPEELAYLFLCVAVGVGFGAGLRIITLFAALLILAIITVHGIFFRRPENDTYNFNVVSRTLSIEDVTGTLRPFVNSIKIKRADTNNEKSNYLFAVEFKSLTKMENAINELKAKESGGGRSKFYIERNAHINTASLLYGTEIFKKERNYLWNCGTCCRLIPVFGYRPEYKRVPFGLNSGISR